MKTTKVSVMLFAVVLMLLSVTACGKNVGSASGSKLSEEAKKICGSWAYVHDKETAIAVFHEDGTAKYLDEDYTFECDEQYIILKNQAGETQKVRYASTENGMLFFNKNTYTHTGEGEPDGLIGDWKCTENEWTFSFSDTGTFIEEGCFAGTYTVDNENSTFKLVYNDPFDDTVCYFETDGNNLYIDYPWPVVKLETK